MPESLQQPGNQGSTQGRILEDLRDATSDICVCAQVRVHVCADVKNGHVPRRWLWTITPSGFSWLRS